MLVTQVFHVGRQVSKKDWTTTGTTSSGNGPRTRGDTLTDVAGSDLLGDLNVRAVDRAEEKTTVQAELHVGRTGGFRTGGRDVLTDVRGGYQHFGQGHGIIRKEEEAKVVLCVRVGVDHTSDIHNEANGLRDSFSDLDT